MQVSAVQGPHTCPCCGHRTLSAPSPGSWLTCPVCAWTDEGSDDPASIDRLFVAQRTYLRTGASAPEQGGMVRAPWPAEARAPDWRPLPGVPDGPSPREEDLARVETAIREAFADVSPDGRESLGDAYRADYLAPPKVDWRDEDTRWQQVPADVLEHFGRATDVFTFGNSASFRYYLPAYMLHELRSRSFFRSVRALDLDVPAGTSPTELERVRVLSPAPREAVVRSCGTWSPTRAPIHTRSTPSRGSGSPPAAQTPCPDGATDRLARAG